MLGLPSLPHPLELLSCISNTPNKVVYGFLEALPLLVALCVDQRFVINGIGMFFLSLLWT